MDFEKKSKIFKCSECGRLRKGNNFQADVCKICGRRAIESLHKFQVWEIIREELDRQDLRLSRPSAYPNLSNLGAATKVYLNHKV